MKNAEWPASFEKKRSVEKADERRFMPTAEELKEMLEAETAKIPSPAEEGEKLHPFHLRQVVERFNQGVDERILACASDEFSKVCDATIFSKTDQPLSERLENFRKEILRRGLSISESEAYSTMLRKIGEAISYGSEVIRWGGGNESYTTWGDGRVKREGVMHTTNELKTLSANDKPEEIMHGLFSPRMLEKMGKDVSSAE